VPITAIKKEDRKKRGSIRLTGGGDRKSANISHLRNAREKKKRTPINEGKVPATGEEKKYVAKIRTAVLLKERSRKSFSTRKKNS